MRVMYTIAVVSPECEMEVRAMRDRASDHAAAVEDYLRDAAASEEPLVAFYRVLMDGWNRTHAVLRDGVLAASPALEARWRELDIGCAVLEPEELAPLDTIQGAPIDPENPGRYAADAFWKTLKEAAGFARATACGVVVVARTLGASIDNGDFNPALMPSSDAITALKTVPDVESRCDYQEALERALVPEPFSQQSGGRGWAIWILFAPSFHAEAAIGFEETSEGGRVIVRTARVHLWEWWGHRVRPPLHLEWLREGLLPPRVWKASCDLPVQQWAPIIGQLRGTEEIWRGSSAAAIDGCGARAWYQNNGVIEAMAHTNVYGASAGVRSLCSFAVSLASRHCTNDALADVLRNIRRYL